MLKSLSWVFVLAIIVGCSEPPPPKVESTEQKPKASVKSGAMAVEKGH